ncbi:MAG TPA: efflux RND transporter periplasmic adaptor subunit [Candidatus Kapabacteria bacterium]|nr:efflux RND transporter periplasmic adaptor subunit [Candidatus Kapabacteria bacterium]
MAESRTDEENTSVSGRTAPPAGSNNPAPPVRRKKRSRTGLVIGIVLLLLVVTVVVAVMQKGGEGDVFDVQVTTATPRTIIQTVTATGAIDPLTQVKISPEVSGEIVYLGVEEGAHVKKGQVLVRINPQSMIAERDESQAQISGARSRMAQSEAQLLRNQQDLVRVQALADKKLATAQELEAAQAQVKIAEADVSAAKYSVAQAEAASRRVSQSLVKTTIVSPISGVVTKLISKLGEKVVGAIQMSGTEMMTVADLSTIETVVNVTETDVVKVAIGDTADVEVDAIRGEKFRAVVTRIANSPKESGTGTQEQVIYFEVRLRFLLPDSRLRPGMTAVATIETDKKQNALSVPIQCVTTREKKEKTEDIPDKNDQVQNLNLQKKAEKPDQIVFVKQGDRVYARKVNTGIRDDQYIEITSGLKAGDQVISGSYKAITKDLKDSSHVKVIDEKKANQTKAKQ